MFVDEDFYVFVDERCKDDPTDVEEHQHKNCMDMFKFNPMAYLV